MCSTTKPCHLVEDCMATYRRVMTYIFTKMLGDTVEYYVDNMLVKLRQRMDQTSQNGIRPSTRTLIKYEHLQCAWESI